MKICQKVGPVGTIRIEGAVYLEFTEDSPVKRSLKTLIFSPLWMRMCLLIPLSEPVFI